MNETTLKKLIDKLNQIYSREGDVYVRFNTLQFSTKTMYQEPAEYIGGEIGDLEDALG